MSKFSVCLLATAVISLAPLMAETAQAGKREACVEGGYGLGWKGGRPYYYRPFGVSGSYDCYNRPNAYRSSRKRSGDRSDSYR